MIEYQFKTRTVSEENMIAYIEDGNGKQLATIFPHSQKHMDRKVVIGMINKALSLLNQYLLDETNQEYAEPMQNTWQRTQELAQAFPEWVEENQQGNDRPKFTRCVFCGFNHVSIQCELAR